MAEITLEFIGEQLQRIQTEQAAIRAILADIQADQETMRDDLATIKGEQSDTKASLTVLGNIALRIERDMVQLKDVFGRLDNRLRKLETAD